ncbi:hypothetical protein [Marivita sp.]|uniref:hypothetical protein n=1 Tax=Marivita sp. TaxID=2003365 RepID=UPI003F6F15ED
MRRILYVMIPLGFVALVAAMIWIGEPTGGPAVPPSEQITTDPLDTSPSPVDPDVVTDPDGDGSDVVPTPSGPEGRDNEVIFE